MEADIFVHCGQRMVAKETRRKKGKEEMAGLILIRVVSIYTNKEIWMYDYEKI